MLQMISWIRKIFSTTIRVVLREPLNLYVVYERKWYAWWWVEIYATTNHNKLKEYISSYVSSKQVK